MKTAIGLFVVLLAAPTLLLAQSINVDLGQPGAARPSDAYRAAGLPGHWNKFDALNPSIHYPLYNLDGSLSSATSWQTGGTEIVTVPLDGPGQPAGDDAILLGDALVTHTTTENCLYFNGLQAGTYEVLMYTWMPSTPATQNRVHIDNNSTVTLVGAAWTGGLTENLTFGRFFIDVSAGGTIGSHSGVPSGGNLAIGAALNGVQIRRLVPEPPLFVDGGQIVWLSSLGATSYDVVRGDLGILRSTGGDFSLATTECLANDLADTRFATADPPAADSGFWYLVRGVGPGGPMTWNSPGGHQAASRDPGIAAASATCP
jgi:hypothetical protein